MMSAARGASLLASALPLVACAALAQSAPAPRQAVPAGGGLTDVAGIRVGHHATGARTGCTVILADSAGAVGGVAQRGGAPGTRETDLLSPVNSVERVNAIVLTGGSAFGLDVAQGVMRYLEERQIGHPTSAGPVPIVPAAVIFDLPFANDPRARPAADCGYRAAAAATTSPVAEGNVGAGAGATVGKLGVFLGTADGPRRTPMKAGVGSASIVLPNGLAVAAIVVVNAVGDIIDPATGRVVAGTRNPDGTLADVRELLRRGARIAGAPRAGENTTIGVIATNARLTKAQANRLALMADDGLARAINPSHTESDGDTMFSLATGTWAGDASVTLIGALAADVVAEAIVRAASRADSLGGLMSARQTGSIPARHR